VGNTNKTLLVYLFIFVYQKIKKKRNPAWAILGVSVNLDSSLPKPHPLRDFQEVTKKQ
jgi:hypothetical protein